MLKRLQKTSILTRLLFWFMVIGLVPLGITISVTQYISSNAIREEVENNLVSTADGKVLQIETYALERKRDVTTLAYTPTVIDAILRLDSLLQEQGADSESYQAAQAEFRQVFAFMVEQRGDENLFLFSDEGDLLFSLHTNEALGSRYTEAFPESELTRVINNARTLLETEFSRFTVAENSQTPVAFIAAPVFDEGLAIGTVVIQINNQDLYAVINDRIGLGETGETVVGFLDGDTLLFAAPTFHKPDSAFQPILAFGDEETQPLREAVQGRQRRGVTTDYRGEEVTAVWRYLPSLRWGMVVKIDTDEAFAPVEQQRNFALSLGVMTLLGLLFVAFVLANSLTRPLRNLVTATKTVAAGVYENKIAVQGGGEIAELVDAFDDLINHTIEQRTQELARVAEQERENNRLKDEFIAVMSHELRTPLNAIIGFLGILQKKGELDETNMHRVTRARVNAERLLALINDILDISRIDSGRVQVFGRPVPTQTFFERLHANMHALAEEKGLAFEVTVSPAMPASVVADEELLTKIVVNLIGNAIKFTEEGSVRVDVSCSDDLWQIAVTDTGVGIPYHMQEVIFERFRQVDGSSTRQHGGTGLGLAIVNSLVKTLGGTVQVKSSPRAGSTFTVTLPLTTPPSDKSSLVAETRGASA